jgi:hypothetical protein
MMSNTHSSYASDEGLPESQQAWSMLANIGQNVAPVQPI